MTIRLDLRIAELQATIARALMVAKRLRRGSRRQHAILLAAREALDAIDEVRRHRPQRPSEPLS